MGAVTRGAPGAVGDTDEGWSAGLQLLDGAEEVRGGFFAFWREKLEPLYIEMAPKRTLQALQQPSTFSSFLHHVFLFC